MFRIYMPWKRLCIYDDTVVNAQDCLVREPKLALEGGKAGLLTFVAKPGVDIERNDDIYVTKTVNDVEDIYWAGRVLSDDRDFVNEKTIEVEGALAYLNDSLQPASNRSSSGMLEHLETLINFHNSQVSNISEHKFTISNVTNNASYSRFYKFLKRSVIEKAIWDARYLMYSRRTRESTLQNFQREFVDVVGGQYQSRPVVQSIDSYTEDGKPIYRYTNEFDYIDAFDTENRQPSQQAVEFGKNLVSITRKASIEDLATVYIPEGRTLTDVEKSWPYYQSAANWKIRRITEYPPKDYSTSELIDYYGHGSGYGYYIDAETGACMQTDDTSYLVCFDIPVDTGDVFFLTTYLEGVSTETSIVPYVILSQDATKVYATGSSVRNSNGQIGKLELIDHQITIPECEAGQSLKLRIARKASNANSTGLILKKLNTRYGEEHLTIMSHAEQVPTSSDPIGKTGIYNVGDDVYPLSTSTPEMVDAFESSKTIRNETLVNAFGIIRKVYSESDANTVDELYDDAAEDLRKMNEKIDIEVQAVDLSYLDPTIPEWKLFDLVPVISEPHAIDTVLPIMKIELPLDSPEKAIYTLRNDSSIKKKEPAYVSKYMAETYKKV